MNRKNKLENWFLLLFFVVLGGRDVQTCGFKWFIPMVAIEKLQILVF